MTNFTNITLALDLSLNGPGFAILATEHDGIRNNPILLEKSYISHRTDALHGEKLTAIGAEIERYFKAYSPDHVVREQGFARFAGATKTLFKVVGVSDVIAYRFGFEDMPEIAATSVKKAVTGDGKASKEDVADAVFRILQIENTSEFYRQTRKGPVLIDDMTDACAVGITYLRQKGLIA